MTSAKGTWKPGGRGRPPAWAKAGLAGPPPKAKQGRPKATAKPEPKPTAAELAREAAGRSAKLAALDSKVRARTREREREATAKPAPARAKPGPRPAKAAARGNGHAPIGKAHAPAGALEALAELRTRTAGLASTVEFFLAGPHELAPRARAIGLNLLRTAGQYFEELQALEDELSGREPRDRGAPPLALEETDAATVGRA